MYVRKRALLPTTIALLAIGAGATGVNYYRSAHAFHPVTGAPITVPGKDGDATLLHNGWKIEPAGRQLVTDDMLLGASLSPDGKILALVSAGYNAHAVHLIDTATEKEIARVATGRAGSGAAWSPDGKKLFVSAGANNGARDILSVAKGETGAWAIDKHFKLPGAEGGKTYVSGIALSPDGQTLYALNMSDGKLYAVSPEGAALFTVAVGDHPAAIRLSRDGKGAYVANLGAAEVAEVNLATPASAGVTRRIKVGEHPNDLALGADGRLYVSCGGADEVSIVDTATGKVEETVRTALSPRAPLGSTPNALALSPDGKRLYVANADNNDVCVVDTSNRSKSRVLGFIPSGWYPTSVAVSADGRKVIVGAGKGTGIGPNPPRDPARVMSFAHMGRQLNGVVSFVDAPSAADLGSMTKIVKANSPYADDRVAGAQAAGKTAIPAKVGDPSPIKYVLYILKENRTYDQVFGDLPQGNGDPKLVLFGRDVTPNHHALAEQFVLLDNLYCNGEVSQDGHPWSDSAYATEFTQRSWTNSYSGKSQPQQARSVTHPPAGYIWQQAARKGLSIRNYGEMRGDPSFGGAANESGPFIGKVGPNQPPPGRDTERADIFVQEFQEFEKKGTIPRFMMMSLGEDHTTGTAPGGFTPQARVASNDLALGKIVDAISHSSVWKEFAIFVIEDDAQNGPDHIDSHRTVGLVISPYTKRKFVDSTMYQTASMLRTMELILGLPPLTQYDAAASPMFNSFTGQADLTPYTLVAAKYDINRKNGDTAYGARESSRMDFRGYDRVDEQALNRILWKSIKGAKSDVPAPVRTVWTSRPGERVAALKREDD